MARDGMDQTAGSEIEYPLGGLLKLAAGLFGRLVWSKYGVTPLQPREHLVIEIVHLCLPVGSTWESRCARRRGL